MDRLRSLFEELGLKNVETVIASGNVLFDSSAKDGAGLERKIERHLEEELGYAVETFVRSPAEIAAMLAARRVRQVEAADAGVSAPYRIS